MCGRFAVTTDPALLAMRIDAVNEVPATAETGPNYNVAPTDPVVVVVSRHTGGSARLDGGEAKLGPSHEPSGSARLDGGEAKLGPPHQPSGSAGPDAAEPTRRVRLMRWGLVPPWTKAGPDGAPAPGGPLLINARADKITTSPAYRSAAQHRRCLVPMDGYYEWRAVGTQSGNKTRKTPYYIHGDGATLWAAGLWSVWRSGPRSDPLLSVTIITTGAVGELVDIHDRMPLLLGENSWDTWLDPDVSVDTALLARPPEVAGIALREVSTLVNSVRNNGPELIAAAEPRPEQGYLL